MGGWDGGVLSSSFADGSLCVNWGGEGAAGSSRLIQTEEELKHFMFYSGGWWGGVGWGL